MIQFWMEPAKTCILGGEMGLSEFLTIITACLEDRRLLLGRFDLIITKKSCVAEWSREYHRSCRTVLP